MSVTREVRVGAMGGSARCRLCGCKPVTANPTDVRTMVQLTVRFPTVPELGERFYPICEACALAIHDALDRPA